MTMHAALARPPALVAPVRQRALLLCICRASTLIASEVLMTALHCLTSAVQWTVLHWRGCRRWRMRATPEQPAS